MWLDAGSAHTCTDYVYSETSKKTLDLHKIVKIEMLNQVKYAESWFFFYELKEKMAILVWNAKSFFFKCTRQQLLVELDATSGV
jgi:hypothetical protein